MWNNHFPCRILRLNGHWLSTIIIYYNFGYCTQSKWMHYGWSITNDSILYCLHAVLKWNVIVALLHDDDNNVNNNNFHKNNDDNNIIIPMTIKKKIL